MKPRTRYDFDDIRRAISAERVAELYGGATVRDHRCAAVWRGGDNESSVAFNQDGSFKDFASGDHGGSVALLAIIRGCSLAEAANFLGDEHCPQLERKSGGGRKEKATRKAPQPEPVMLPAEQQPPPPEVLPEIPVMPPLRQSKVERLEEDGWTHVADYHYCEADGTYAYTVARYERDGKKTFLQHDADGVGISRPPMLYRLPQVVAAEEVWVVEGEKDADTLDRFGIVATTNSSGCRNWSDDFSPILSGKRVVISRDNDSEGLLRAITVARSVHPFAASVRIVCPSTEAKGDVTDYLDGGSHTILDLRQLAESAPLWHPETRERVTPQMVELAKALNAQPFRNFRVLDRQVGKREVIEPLPVSLLCQELFDRFLGYPCLLGRDSLFDQDRDTHELIMLSNEEALFAWISRKGKQNYEWQTGRGFVSRKEFFHAVRQCARRYEMVSTVPSHPVQENIYYTFPTLPAPTPDHHAFLQLCDFFSPYRPWHGYAIRALFAAPIWYRPMIARPSWIIDSAEGAGVGKTTLVEFVARLYQCEPIDTSVEQLYRHYEELVKRLVSEGGRRSRIVLLDNLTVNFSCGQFASLITKSSITGRAPYSSGEDTRPNNLTYCITSNSAQVDNDLISRSFFISLRRPNYNGNWKRQVSDYIEQNRWQIFADLLDMLQAHCPFPDAPQTRYPEFEQEVIQPMCGTEEHYLEFLEGMRLAREAANIEQDTASQLTDGIRYKLAEVLANSGRSPADCCVWITSDLLKAWGKEICETYISSATVRNFAKNGLTDYFSSKLDRFPRSTKDVLRRSGVMWLGENSGKETGAYIVGLRGGKPVTLGVRELTEEER